MSRATPSSIWHPFTQHALQPSFPTVELASGAYLTLKDGTRILDAISSWWVITHGHYHPTITAAIKAQAEKLDQVIFAEFTHEPAEALAAQLIALAPPALEHVFFSELRWQAQNSKGSGPARLSRHTLGRPFTFLAFEERHDRHRVDKPKTEVGTPQVGVPSRRYTDRHLHVVDDGIPEQSGWTPR